MKLHSREEFLKINESTDSEFLQEVDNLLYRKCDWILC